MLSQRDNKTGVAQLQIYDELKADSRDKDELLNELFQSVFTQDNRKQSRAMEGPEYPIIDSLNIQSKEVDELVQKLRVNKASGPDDLPAFIHKETTSGINLILIEIFKQSLKTVI